MIAEKGTNRKQVNWGWLRLALSVLVAGIVLWAVGREMDFRAVWSALRLANPLYIALALALTTGTSWAKSWRWGLLLASRGQDGARRIPAGRDRFRAVMLGQFLNLLIFRIGDLARVYELGQRSGFSKARLMGTLVIEKFLDLTVLVVTVVAVLPFVVLPAIIRNPAGALGAILIPAVASLYLIAFQTARFTRLLTTLTRRLPDPLERRANRLIIAGLEGFSALRDWRLNSAIYGVSLLIGGLSVLTPLLLFAALGLPLGLKEAILLHLITSIGSVPPTTPARLGVFEWLVVFMLAQLGQADENLRLSYALLYHSVVLLPQLTLGAVALAQSRWRRLPEEARQ